MPASIVSHVGFATRKILLVSVLSLIGMFVGASAVLLPLGIPFGVVGIAAGLLLWLLPELRVVPTRWTSVLLVPFMISTLCIPNYYGLILPGLPWISLRRAVLFAWIVPFTVVLAGSSESRAFIARCLREDRLLSSLLAAYCVVIFITTFTALNVSLSLNYNFNFALNCMAPLSAALFVTRNQRTLETVLKCCIIAVLINLIAGAIESRLQRPFLIFLLPQFMRDQVLASNPMALLTLFRGLGLRNGLYRASSTFGTPLSWGEVSAMLMPACVHFFVYGRTGYQRSYGVAGFLMCCMSVYFSGSRGAYVGMLVALVAYSLVFALRSFRRNPGSLAGGIWLTICSVLSLSAVLAVLFVGRIHRMVLGGGEAQGSTESRSIQWALAKPKIMAKPLFGYGGGSAGEVIGYQVGGGFSVDGYYMNLLVDYGVIGFLVFFAIFLTASYNCLKIYVTSDAPVARIGAALGTGLLAFTFYRTTLSQTDSLPLAFVMVGFTIALRKMVNSADQP